MNLRSTATLCPGRKGFITCTCKYCTERKRRAPSKVETLEEKLKPVLFDTKTGTFKPKPEPRKGKLETPKGRPKSDVPKVGPRKTEQPKGKVAKTGALKSKTDGRGIETPYRGISGKSEKSTRKPSSGILKTSIGSRGGIRQKESSSSIRSISDTGDIPPGVYKPKFGSTEKTRTSSSVSIGTGTKKSVTLLETDEEKKRGKGPSSDSRVTRQDSIKRGQDIVDEAGFREGDYVLPDGDFASTDENYIVPKGAFAPSQEGFGPLQRDFRSSQESFQPSKGSRAQGSLSPTQKGLDTLEGVFIPSKGRLIPSQGGFVPSQGSFAPSQGSFAPSQGSFVPLEEGRASSQLGFRPSQRGLIPSQGDFVPSQGSLELPREGFPSTEGGFLSPEEGASPETGFVPLREGSTLPGEGFATSERGIVPPEKGKCLGSCSPWLNQQNMYGSSKYPVGSQSPKYTSSFVKPKSYEHQQRLSEKNIDLCNCKPQQYSGVSTHAAQKPYKLSRDIETNAYTNPEEICYSSCNTDLNRRKPYGIQSKYSVGMDSREFQPYQISPIDDNLEPDRLNQSTSYDFEDEVECKAPCNIPSVHSVQVAVNETKIQVEALLLESDDLKLESEDLLLKSNKLKKEAEDLRMQAHRLQEKSDELRNQANDLMLESGNIYSNADIPLSAYNANKTCKDVNCP